MSAHHRWGSIAFAQEKFSYVMQKRSTSIANVLNVPKITMYIFSPIIALYLTITVTICGANILIQMMLMNMHYVTPIRPVPRWLQIVRGILSCRFSRHRGDVDPTNGPKDPELDAGVAVDKVDANNFDMDSALLKEILVLSEKVKSDEKENAMAEEWKEIANLLDRLLFYIFIVYQVAMAIVCFGIVPAMQPKPDSDAV